MKRLYIKQQVFSIGEKFTVTDEQQNVQYRVEGSFFRIPKNFKIMNQRQQEIGVVTKEIFTLLPRFHVEMRGRQVATIVKELTFLKARYSISVPGLDVLGDWWDMSFRVKQGGKEVATINKRWFSWGDTYEVSILEPKLEELIVSLVIAIDCVKADQAAAASSAPT